MGFASDVEDPVSAVAAVFGVDEERARLVVARAPVTIKRGVPEETARTFVLALRGAGGEALLTQAGVTPEGVAPAAPEAKPPSMPPPASAPPRFDLGAIAWPMEQATPKGAPSWPMENPDFAPDWERAGLTPEQTAPRGAAPVPVGVYERAPAPAAAAPPPPGPLDQPLVRTAVPVAWYCPRCDESFPEESLGRIDDPRLAIRPRACPACKGIVRREGRAAKGGYLAALAGAFAYPLQTAAFPTYVGVAVVAQVLGYVPAVGGILSTGTVLGFMFAVLKASGAGEDEVPDGQDFTEVTDFVGPIARYYFALFLCFLPAGAAFWAFGLHDPRAYLLGSIGGFFGLLYVPAALVLAAHGKGCLGINPIAGAQIILRIPGAYFLTAAATGAVTVVVGGVAAVLAILVERLPVPFFPGVIAVLITLYPSIVTSRMLGLLLFYHRGELGLDGDEP